MLKKLKGRGGKKQFGVFFWDFGDFFGLWDFFFLQERVLGGFFFLPWFVFGVFLMVFCSVLGLFEGFICFLNVFHLALLKKPF